MKKRIIDTFSSFASKNLNEVDKKLLLGLHDRVIHDSDVFHDIIPQKLFRD